MIDLVYKTVTTIINKEINGYVAPDEFNKIANLVQQNIFKNYFEDANRDKNKKNSNLTNKGYSNLPFNQRYKINQFSEIDSASKNIENFYELPSDLFLLEDDGVTSISGEVIEEVERREIGYLNRSIAKPTLLYPVYTNYRSKIKVYPDVFTEDIELRYIRQPKEPKWTYNLVLNGTPFFNPTKEDFQDFELHPSEFSKIVFEILMFFGVNLREVDIIKVSSELSQKEEFKENN